MPTSTSSSAVSNGSSSLSHSNNNVNNSSNSTSSASSQSVAAALDSSGATLAFQMVVRWLQDRNVKVTFLFGRNETLHVQVRVIEASASLNVHDPDLVGARVVKQLLQELEKQLRREDALHLTWQQERAARESRRSNDVKNRPQLPLTNVDENTRQRNLVVNELFNTELDFVEDLSLVFNKYMRPMREGQLLSEERILELFGNIEVIYELHLAFLASLQSAVVSGCSSDALARCFLNLMAGGALAHFSTYAVGLQAADTLLATNFGGKMSSKLTKFLNNPQLVAQCDGLSLSALLVKPIQRICKYTLLLPNIVRYTPNSDPDYVKLQDASSLLADLVQRVNARKLSAEGRDAAQRVAKHISCDSTDLANEFEEALDSGSAELLFDAAVDSLLPTEGENEPRTKPIHLYVLNTALLICEPASRQIRAIPMSPRHQSLMKLVAVVDWQSCLVVDVRSIGSHAFVFAVHGSGLVWRMSAATAGLKAQCFEVMHARTTAAQEPEGLVVSSAASLSIMLSDIQNDSDDAFNSDLFDVLHSYEDDGAAIDAAAFAAERPNALLPPPSLSSVPRVTPPAASSPQAPSVPKTAPPPPLSPPPQRRTAPSKPKTAPPTKTVTIQTHTETVAPAIEQQLSRSRSSSATNIVVEQQSSPQHIAAVSRTGSSTNIVQEPNSPGRMSRNGSITNSVAEASSPRTSSSSRTPSLSKESSGRSATHHVDIIEPPLSKENSGRSLPPIDDDPHPAPDEVEVTLVTPVAPVAPVAQVALTTPAREPSVVASDPSVSAVEVTDLTDSEAEKWRNRCAAMRKRAVAVERRHALRVSHLEQHQTQRAALDVLQERLVASQRREWQLSEVVEQLRDDLARLSVPEGPTDANDIATQLLIAKSDLKRLEATLAAKAQQFFESFSEMEGENARLRRELAQRDQEIANLKLQLGADLVVDDHSIDADAGDNDVESV